VADDVIVIIDEETTVDVTVETTQVVVVEIPGPPGPMGPTGSGYEHTQTIPSATWVINHPLGRMPNVTIYFGSEQVDTDIVASPTVVTVIFPAPATGVAVLV
jgi:hypothetical protein